MTVLSGKPVAKKIAQWCQQEVAQLRSATEEVPYLQVLQYGDDAASKSYVGAD